MQQQQQQLTTQSSFPSMTAPMANPMPQPAAQANQTSSSEKNEMMKLLLALNDGVRSLGSRFDTYQ